MPVVSLLHPTLPHLTETLVRQTKSVEMGETAGLAASESLSAPQQAWLDDYVARRRSMDSARDVARTLVGVARLGRPEVFDCAASVAAQGKTRAKQVARAFHLLGEATLAGTVSHETVDAVMDSLRLGPQRVAATSVEGEPDQFGSVLARLGLNALNGPFDPEGERAVRAAAESILGVLDHLRANFPWDATAAAQRGREYAPFYELPYEEFVPLLAEVVRAHLEGNWQAVKYSKVNVTQLGELRPEQLEAWKKRSEVSGEADTLAVISEARGLVGALWPRMGMRSLPTEAELSEEIARRTEDLRARPPADGRDERAHALAHARELLGVREVFTHLQGLGADSLGPLSEAMGRSFRAWTRAAQTDEERARLKKLKADCAVLAGRSGRGVLAYDGDGIEEMLNAYDATSCMSPVGDRAFRRWGPLAALLDLTRILRVQTDDRLDLRALLRIVHLELPAQEDGRPAYSGPALWIDPPHGTAAGEKGAAQERMLYQLALAKGLAMDIPVATVGSSNVPMQQSYLESYAAGTGMEKFRGEIPRRPVHVSSGNAPLQYSENLFQYSGVGEFAKAADERGFIHAKGHHAFAPGVVVPPRFNRPPG